MPRAHANGIELEYEVMGDPEAPPVVLIMGLAAQMIFWHDEFCAELVARGRRVIRFDNRDIGLSTKMEGTPVAVVMQKMMEAFQGRPVTGPYTLGDMADDTAGLLDVLGIASAHIVGVSMGGMIAQELAIRHPSRVRTLTSIMSTTGDPSLPPPTAEAMRVLMTPPAPTREATIERGLEIFRVIGSPGYAFDEPAMRRHFGRAWDRNHDAAGPARQLLAVFSAHSRRQALAAVRVPTLVIHGADDPLVPLAAGKDTAASVPGARLLVIPGMGHDLARGAWPILLNAIAEHTTANNGG